MTRLNKYLAECGICSRREADKLIGQGRVSVDGHMAERGTRISGNEAVEVDGRKVSAVPPRVVLAYNKPVGVTCTEKDRHAEKTITEALKYPIRLTYAGRLDRESGGLIIMTNDGDLIQCMMKGANCHEKEYIVKVDREITPEFLSGMAGGVFLKELGVTTRPCRLEYIGKYTFKIVLTQGLNRQIRRMCEAFGYKVASLLRVRVVNIGLGGLKSGEYRELGGLELSELYRLCGMKIDENIDR